MFDELGQAIGRALRSRDVTRALSASDFAPQVPTQIDQQIQGRNRREPEHQLDADADPDEHVDAYGRPSARYLRIVRAARTLPTPTG